MNLNDLYQEIILEHYKEPHNKGQLQAADARSEGRNPMCGDEIQVSVKIKGDLIEDIRFEGSGCAISQASASVMTKAVKGSTLEQAEKTLQAFSSMIKDGGAFGEIDPESELAAFQGVSEYPTRIKCALLAWNALKNSLDQITR
ncbi:MAG: SUF system NifU family Fe-S cluster assembly protein [candidate division KSB1 bacterium]|nr:SUF system NifU family Fe-S cluster assembly protein [candidate division KSB1 bacterium]